MSKYEIGDCRYRSPVAIAKEKEVTYPLFKVLNPNAPTRRERRAKLHGRTR